MKRFKITMMPFLMAWTIAIVLLSGPLTHAAEIVGHWLNKNQTGNTIYFFFGPEDDFFIEDEASWIQGTYTIEPDSTPGQLDLFIQDGSNVEDVGKAVRYLYDIDDDLLIISATDPVGTDRLSILEVVNPVGNTVFIGINTDPSDEDDKEDEPVWNVYASCFVMSSMAE